MDGCKNRKFKIEVNKFTPVIVLFFIDCIISYCLFNISYLQVEFCYPALVPENPTELPPAWRHLPALALPDGSHNYLSDTIFFHLPGLKEPTHTVYAISCFRQIPLEVRKPYF